MFSFLFVRHSTVYMCLRACAPQKPFLLFLDLSFWSGPAQIELRKMLARRTALTFACLLFSNPCTAEPVQQHSAPGRLTGTSFGIHGVNATYDYVIVGAGVAGSVLANRLAEDPDVSVAVVEAGGFYELSNGNVSQIPFYARDFVGDDGGDWTERNWQPLIDWGIVTQPEPVGPCV